MFSCRRSVRLTLDQFERCLSRLRTARSLGHLLLCQSLPRACRAKSAVWTSFSVTKATPPARPCRVSRRRPGPASPRPLPTHTPIDRQDVKIAAPFIDKDRPVQKIDSSRKPSGVDGQESGSSILD